MLFRKPIDQQCKSVNQEFDFKWDYSVSAPVQKLKLVASFASLKLVSRPNVLLDALSDCISRLTRNAIRDLKANQMEEMCRFAVRHA